MSRPLTDELIAALADDASPVKPLAPPLQRGLAALGVLATVAALFIFSLGDVSGLGTRYLGREALMLAEMGAMLATGVLGVLGAFFVSIPGRSRQWLLAPLPSFAVWVGLSGFGCYRDFVAAGAGGWAAGHSVDCFTFLLGTGALVGIPLFWLLSRARPVDSLPVATLGGLGVAAISAFLLQFFHPFALTAIDLAVHGVAIAVVVAIASLSRRRTLTPA